MKSDFVKNLMKNAAHQYVDWDCDRYVLEGNRVEDFSSLISLLESNGIELVQRHSIGKNAYATLRAEDGDVILAYFDYNHTVVCTTDAMTDRQTPPLAPVAYETLTSPKLALMTLTPDGRGNPGNGMGYVLTLSDGSYLIFDGGYWEDAESTIAYLEANNVRNEKPHVAAWLLTHSHNDHYDCLRRIGQEFSDRITVEEFIVSPRISRYEMEQYEPYIGEQFTTETVPMFAGAKVIKPHTGQKLYYRDAEIEILQTQEDYPPRHFRWINEASIVSRVSLGGQSILFLGDAEIGASVYLPTVYGDALRSDFLQVAHHGWSGSNFVMYDLIRPRFAMWNCRGHMFEEYRQKAWTRTPNWYLEEIIEEGFVAEGDHHTLVLPYRPKE